MQNQDQFINYLLERMQAPGPVRAGALFGGYGICIDNADAMTLRTGKSVGAALRGRKVTG